MHWPTSFYQRGKKREDASERQQNLQLQNTKVHPKSCRRWWRQRCCYFFPLYGTTQNQKNVFCSHKNSHSADVHMYTCNKTHTQGLVSIFRTSLGIWCLKLEGHFVKQISACWKKIKTCCPCVSISVRVCVGGFISFFGTLWVCAKGTCFNFVSFFLSFFTPALK